MGRRKGPKKPKVAAFELIDHEARPQLEPYKLMSQVRREYHDDIEEAKIVLVWRKGLKPDVDGHLILGRCHKASDFQKELVDWDYAIELNFEVWQSSEFTKEKKLALLDHELCHCGEALDKDGEPKVDVKGRRVWRMVSHDIEEFQSVISHHGCYKRDLERFAETIIKQAQKTLEFPTQATGTDDKVVVQ